MCPMSLPFEKLFGLPASKIKKHAVLCPGNDASLFCDTETVKLHVRGQLFGVFDTEYFSIITTKYNLHIGDCVLSLKDTPCENIYLFGSCGGLGNIEIGDAFLINKAYDYEGFSRTLKNGEPGGILLPDKKLLETFKLHVKAVKVIPSACVTVSSIVLEEPNIENFLGKRISCVDMESSIVFSAAKHIGRKAIATLYVTDIIGQKPFSEPLNSVQAVKVKQTRLKLANALKDFILRFVVAKAKLL